MSGDPGRIKCLVALASAMAWSTSIFILDVLNSVYWFGESMLLMEESSDSGSIRDVTSSVQMLWTMVLSYSSSSSL